MVLIRLERWKQKDQEFGFIFPYMRSSRPAKALRERDSLKKEKKVTWKGQSSLPSPVELPHRLYSSPGLSNLLSVALINSDQNNLGGKRFFGLYFM